MGFSKSELNMKKAIVNRVQQVLDNAKNIDDLTIHVNAPRDEVATVKYSVSEFILPEDNQ